MKQYVFFILLIATSFAFAQGNGNRNGNRNGNANENAGGNGNNNFPWTELNGNVYYNGGNVGIGLDAPTSRLHILSDETQSTNFLRFSTTNTSDYFQIANATQVANQFIPSLKGHRATDNQAALFLTGSTSDANDSGSSALVNFNARRTNGLIQNRPLFAWANFDQNVMTLNAKGNLGIGTPNPLSKLHVFGDDLGTNQGDQALLAIFEGKTGNRSKLQILNHRNENGTDWFTTSLRLQRVIDNTAMAFIDFGIEDKSADYGLAFGTRDGTNGTQETRMVIDRRGNVGIGKTTPERKLDVNGSIASQEFINVQKEGSYLISLNGQEHGYIVGRNSSYETKFQIGSNGITYFNGGNIGFGTTTPTEKLDVVGNAKVDGNIVSTGKISIGTAEEDPDYMLTVKGKIHVQEVKVDLNGAIAPDYVFYKDYDLKTLEQVQEYIKQEGHLPNIPSAAQMEKEGLNLKAMNFKLLEKVEELTLYTIAQEKAIKAQEQKNKELEERLNQLEKLLQK